MGATEVRETAKIYDIAAFRRTRAAHKAGEEAKVVRAPASNAGAWYHDAAIRDDDRTRRPL